MSVSGEYPEGFLRDEKHFRISVHDFQALRSSKRTHTHLQTCIYVGVGVHIHNFLCAVLSREIR